MRISDWSSDVCSRSSGQATRRVGSDDLQLEGQIWRPGGVRGEAFALARGRERQAQAVAGRRHAGQCRAERSSRKKNGDARRATGSGRTSPGSSWMSERRACRVIDADRKSMRYRSKRGDDAELRVKLRERSEEHTSELQSLMRISYAV